MKKVISLFIVLAMFFSVCSFSAFADGDSVIVAGETEEEIEATPEPAKVAEPEEETLAEKLDAALYYVDPRTAFSYNNISSIALEELSSSKPNGSSSCFKYSKWYYGLSAKPVDAIEDFDGQEPNEPLSWNALFITWCANQLGYVDAGKFPRTDSGAVLHSWFVNSSYASEHTKSEISSMPQEYTPSPDDLIFFPTANDYRVGIVTQSEKRMISYVIGDIGGSVRLMTSKISELPDNTSIIHWKSDNDFLLAYIAFMHDEIGLNRAAAVGVLANMYAESGLNPHSLGDNGSSYGLCQWHNGRWLQMVGVCNEDGYDWETTAGQLHYLKYEMENYFAYLVPMLNAFPNNAEGAHDAAALFCVEFEIPAYAEECGEHRGEMASGWLYPSIFG